MNKHYYLNNDLIQTIKDKRLEDKFKSNFTFNAFLFEMLTGFEVL